MATATRLGGIGERARYRRRARALSIAFVALASGCGSGSGDGLGQTGVSGAAGGGGAGGGAAGAAGSAGSAGAAGGAGGAAGAAGACAGSLVVSPAIFVGAQGALLLGKPKLVVTSAGRVHVLAHAAFAQPEGPTPIVRASFDAAATWPPAVTPLAETGLFLDPSAARIVADAQGDALLVASSSLEKPAGPPTSFAVQLLPAEAPAPGPPLGIVMVAAGFQIDDLLAQPDGALVAYTTPAAMHYVEAVVSVTKTGVAQIENPSAGCSLQSTRGALARAGGSAFLAAATSPLSPADGCDGGPAGMATSVSRLDASGAIAVAGSLDMGALPMTLLAAGSGQDLWVLSEYLGGGEDAPPLPAHLVRLDPTGKVLAEQPMLPDGGIVVSSMAIAPIGKHLAVTAVRVDGTDLKLGLRVYDPSLAQIGDVVLTEPQGSDGKHLGGTRATAVAAGGAVFVAWESVVSGAPGIAVARVDCLP